VGESARLRRDRAGRACDMSHAGVSAASPRGRTGDGVGRVTCHTRRNGVDLACDMSHAGFVVDFGPDFGPKF